MRGLTNTIGFDDGPFERTARGNVLLVGCVCSRTRLDGVVSARVRRDGANADVGAITRWTKATLAITGSVRCILQSGNVMGSQLTSVRAQLQLKAIDIATQSTLGLSEASEVQLHLDEEIACHTAIARAVDKAFPALRSAISER